MGIVTKTHGPGRAVAVGVLLAGMLLPWCPCTMALNPALDVSQYAHTAWKVREGFVKGEINAIVQTPDGYLWLGTEFGLLRFDGVRTLEWQPPANQGLLSGMILSLLVGHDGTLWIGTSKGLASWKDGKLTQYPELADQYIFALSEDREGAVWVGTWGIPTGKLCAIHSRSVHCYGEDGRLGRGVFSLHEDSNGVLWAGVTDGLWRWKPGPPKFYSLPGEPNGIRIGEDADGALLIGRNGGIQRFMDGKTKPYSHVSASRRFSATKMLRDRDGGLWIGTLGAGLVHAHRGKTDVYLPNDGLSGGVINTLFEDREGSIWVGTLNGLDRFREFAVATFAGKQGLSNALVGSVLADKDGSVWLATYGGLNRWDHGQITIAGTGSAKRDGKLNGKNPNSLFQDGGGRIWISTNSGFGYLVNNHFISVNGVPGGQVHGIAADTEKNLWIANQEHGLMHLSGNKVVEQIAWSSLKHKDDAGALAADRLRGGLWLGFYKGGVAYFSEGRIRATYTDSDGLGDGGVNGFLTDHGGTLWAATEGGVSRFQNGHFVTLTSKNGLPCDSVHWMIEDDDGSFWLYMPCGLVRIAHSSLDACAAAVDRDKDTKQQIQATVFDSSDGVRTVAVAGGYTPQVTKTSDGEIWFPAMDGVSVIDPRHLPFNKLPPPVYVEQIIADDKVYADAGAGALHLPPRINHLEIDYTALSLAAPEKVFFRYKLEGFDTDWRDAGNRRQAFYTNLPPKNYAFRVKACNNSGVWNEAGAFLDFSVAPAYYQTTWFLVTCVAAFLALLWTLYQLRVQQLAREFNVGLEARVNERTRIARELHDSLLQGFQGLMFRLQAVRDLLPGRAAEAIEALDTALERGDKAIAEGRDTVSDLREPIMGDGDIAKALTALGEELAAQDGNASFPCVRVLVEGKQRRLNPMLRDEVYRIGREALRNAFHHARAQKIEAEITYGESKFLFNVRDDGIGLAPEVADRGDRAGHWGLPGMRERAKSFGGKLEVWSEHGAGTEIELIVPAAIAYGGPEARRRFWFSRKKAEGTDEQQS